MYPLAQRIFTVSNLAWLRLKRGDFTPNGLFLQGIREMLHATSNGKETKLMYINVHGQNKFWERTCIKTLPENALDNLNIFNKYDM